MNQTHPDPCPACGFRPRGTVCAFCGLEIPRHAVTFLPAMPPPPPRLHRLWQCLLDRAPFAAVAVALWLAFVLVAAFWR